MTEVAAAIIKNENDEILICKRGPGGSTAFLWEFPGGKREMGESLRECLIRECDEELAIQICVEKTFATTTYNYPEITIDFTFFDAVILAGVITPKVHEAVLWINPDKLHLYDFCPADIEIVERLTYKK